jgi:hypothetical protein
MVAGNSEGIGYDVELDDAPFSFWLLWPPGSRGSAKKGGGGISVGEATLQARDNTN